MAWCGTSLPRLPSQLCLERAWAILYGQLWGPVEGCTCFLGGVKGLRGM